MKKILLLVFLTLGISCTVCIAGCTNKPAGSGASLQTRIVKAEAEDESPENESPEGENTDDGKHDNECPDGKCGKKKIPCPKRGGKGKKPTGDDFEGRKKHRVRPPKRDDIPNSEYFVEAE